MGATEEALKDVNDEDIGTGGYSHAFGAAAALVDPGELAVGRYYMISDQTVWVKRGGAAVVAAKAIASEFKLRAGVYWPVRVTARDLAVNSSDGAGRAFFSVVRDSADGTIEFYRVDRNGV